jgi:hypothetical protein
MYRIGHAHEEKSEAGHDDGHQKKEAAAYSTSSSHRGEYPKGNIRR